MVMMRQPQGPGSKLPPRCFPLPQPLPQPFPLPTSQDSIVDQATFALMDGDGDGKLSKDEFKRAGWTDERVKSFDGDGDGAVTEKEFTQTRGYEREFAKKDWSGDGKLTEREFNGIRPIFRKDEWFSKLGLKAAEKPVEDLTGPWIEGVKSVKEAASNAAEDAVGAGQKIASNFVKPFVWTSRFDQADTNKDQSVSKEEYIASRRKQDARPDWGTILDDGPIAYKHPALKSGTDTLQLSAKKQAE